MRSKLKAILPIIFDADTVCEIRELRSQGYSFNDIQKRMKYEYSSEEFWAYIDVMYNGIDCWWNNGEDKEAEQEESA